MAVTVHNGWSLGLGLHIKSALCRVGTYIRFSPRAGDYTYWSIHRGYLIEGAIQIGPLDRDYLVIMSRVAPWSGINGT